MYLYNIIKKNWSEPGSQTQQSHTLPLLHQGSLKRDNKEYFDEYIQLPRSVASLRY